MEAPNGPENGRSDRQLRIFTIAALIPAFALLIPSGVVTYQPLPAIGLVPMAMSALLGVTTLASRKTSTYGRTWADIIVAVSLLAVLIPRQVQIPSECSTTLPVVTRPAILMQTHV
jgi:hypothetical protein